MGGGGVRKHLIAAGTLLLIAAAPARAAEPLPAGVHVDPGSPAAKEYALPLQQARRNGSPNGSSGEGQLFGAGIKPPGGSGGTGGTPAKGGGSPGAPSGAGISGGGTASSPAGSQGAGQLGGAGSARRATASSGLDGSTLALIGGGVAIVVLGAFGGTVLRHNRRPPLPPPADPG